MRYRAFTITFLTLFIPLSLQAESPPLRLLRHIAMATDFEAILYGKSASTDPESLLAAGREAFVAVDLLENNISSWKTDSWTSLVNRKAAEGPVTVSSDLIELLEESRIYYNATGGVFDVTVGPLIDLWRKHATMEMLPNPEEVKQVLGQIGLKYVMVDKNARTVSFAQDGLRLDFGGIAKGLALDRMANVLRDEGVDSARLSAGTSTILALGAPPDDNGWTVDIRSPYNTDDTTHIATVKIRDESLSTSANTSRFFLIDGKRYSHIIDPRTGAPADSGISSATVIAPTGIESDALSTAFFIMGVEAARAYCSAHPQIRAILVRDEDGSCETIYINFTDDLTKEP